MAFSLDVDGVLEDDGLGFSATSIAGVAALKLLQIGGVAVVLNTARAIDEARARCETFQLLGAVSAFGGIVWDGVFDREEILSSRVAQAQLTGLRSALRSDPDAVIASAHHVSLRVSRIVDGVPGPIVGGDAADLLDKLGLDQLSFWVAPSYTDFIDRSVDKGAGLERLLALLGIRSLPLAAMGDAENDVPMLRLAHHAFLPAATLPAYHATPAQRLVRARSVGGMSLWEAACHLVPDATAQRQVFSQCRDVKIPDWLPRDLRLLPGTVLDSTLTSRGTHAPRQS